MNVTSLWQPVIIWLLILVVFVVIELFTMGLTTIWFAGGALGGAAASLFGASTGIQIVVFLVISIGLLLSARPIAVKYFNKDRVKTNVESMIGRQAIVVSEIDNLRGIGRVTVGGLEWSARTGDDAKTLPVGAVATVTAVDGVKLIVEEKVEEL